MLAESIYLGISHIGATVNEWHGPSGFHFPGGIDHILFLLALALGSKSIWETVKTASGFTVGHSLTLSLAALGLVHPPTRWIEAAIALSIAFLAAESLFKLKSRGRWQIAAAFGLVHGFGFASALQNLKLGRSDMLLTLFGFNLGVEIGQMMILVPLVAVIAAMREAPVLERFGLRGCSFGVMGTGLYWFIVRAWG